MCLLYGEQLWFNCSCGTWKKCRLYGVSALERFCYKGSLRNLFRKKFFVCLRQVSALEDPHFREVPLHINNFLNELFCGFHKAHSTQHALFKLLQAWQKKQDNSGFIGTIHMDLSKAYDCLSHDLLIAKLGEHGLHRSSLRLLMCYFNSHKQRRKVG